MELNPEYAENVITAIIYNNELFWYVTKKDIWYMDEKKYIKMFEEAGYKIDLNNADDLRRNILILDRDNIEIFMHRLEKYVVSTKELNDFLKKELKKNDEWFFDLSPSFYLNFDEKIFYSLYREYAKYENYVPAGWYGEYEDFMEKIPLKYRYWSDEYVKDYFKLDIKNNKEKNEKNKSII